MTQSQLVKELEGKTILNINFIENSLKIQSIAFIDGELLTLTEVPTLSHPEKEEEFLAFEEVLKNIPLSGIITFKAKYLSQSLIDRKISEKHKDLKSNGYGQINTSKQDHISYRFDMPNN